MSLLPIISLGLCGTERVVCLYQCLVETGGLSSALFPFIPSYLDYLITIFLHMVYHCSKRTGASANMKSDCSTFRQASFRVLVSSMLAHCHLLLEQLMELSHCKQTLFHLWVSWSQPRLCHQLRLLVFSLLSPLCLPSLAVCGVGVSSTWHSPCSLIATFASPSLLCTPANHQLI